MAARWRYYRVSVTIRHGAWEVVYTRTVYANSKLMAAFRASFVFPDGHEGQAGNASDVTVEAA